MPPGADFGNLPGTMVAVVYSNVWTTRTGRPTSIVPVPSIFLLVSGTIGFRGLASLASGGIAVGEQEIVHVSVVALTISAAMAFLLGILLLEEWPLSGLWAIGTLVGINMLFVGFAMISIASAARKLVRAAL